MAIAARSLEAPDKLFRLLADATRLRAIRALAEAPLTVTELRSVLGVPQSTVSRHLGLMRKGGLVADRREGARVWYSLADGLLRHEALMGVIRESLGRLSDARADGRRLGKVLERRRTESREFFDSVAGSYHGIAEPGGGAEGLVSAMMMAMPKSVVVDVGCGEGETAIRLARFGHTVHAVDSSRRMIAALRRRLRREGAKRVKPHVGDIEKLPLEGALGDVVLLSQILHHAPRPGAAIREAARVAKPGGRVVVLDLLAHEQEWTRERMGDLWLGFALAEIARWMRDAGLESVRLDTVEVDEGLPLVVCGGTRGAAA
ncbi:MAG: ArsR/SmtB family transcription factor [Planctomycetota bacterium]|jgi:ArsR family transcriptional regulator